MSNQALKILSRIVKHAGDLGLLAAVLAPGQMSPQATNIKKV